MKLVKFIKLRIQQGFELYVMSRRRAQYWSKDRPKVSNANYKRKFKINKLENM